MYLVAREVVKRKRKGLWGQTKRKGLGGSIVPFKGMPPSKLNEDF